MVLRTERNLSAWLVRRPSPTNCAHIRLAGFRTATDTCHRAIGVAAGPYCVQSGTLPGGERPAKAGETAQADRHEPTRKVHSRVGIFHPNQICRVQVVSKTRAVAERFYPALYARR